MADFFLPGSQPLEAGDLSSPIGCNCHEFDDAVDPYFNWEGSMMAQSMRDPLFTATMAIAIQDADSSGDLCLRCHTPTGWLSGRSDPPDGTALDDREGDFTGVNSLFCHRMVAPAELGENKYSGDSYYTTNTYPADQTYLNTISAHIPSTNANGMFVVSDEDIRRGPYSDADPNSHAFYYSPFHQESELCGTCHDVSNPVFVRDPDNLGEPREYAAIGIGDTATTFDPYEQFPVERTYSEWLMSAYNTPGGISGTAFGGNKSSVSTCQDCHMQDITAKGANQGVDRTDMGWHDLTGGNTFIGEYLKTNYANNVVNDAAIDSGMSRATKMLQLAATMSVEAVFDSVTVTITNETGHKLPSGYPEGRRMWINMKAYLNQSLIQESGAYDPSTGVLSHGVTDPTTKIYEIKPGLSYDHGIALGYSESEIGPSFHFVLNDTIYKDNRIPPRGFTNANFELIQSPAADYFYSDGQYWDITGYKLPQMPDSVVVTLYYQTTSKEYVEFLRDENVTNTTGDDLYTYWNTNGKSAPVIMNQVILAANDISLPVELLSFSGKFENGKISLEWQTASELENLGFNILRAKEIDVEFIEVSGFRYNEDLIGLGNSSTGKIYNFIDEDSLQEGMTYIYKLQDVSINGVITEHGPIAVLVSNLKDGSTVTNQFALYQNYPNPFNPITTIPFSLDRRTLIEIKIFDVNGRLVKRYTPKNYYPGNYSVQWDGKDNVGRNIASGIYYYELSTIEKRDLKKMILIR
jgi:hypothetical protein